MNQEKERSVCASATSTPEVEADETDDASGNGERRHRGDGKFLDGQHSSSLAPGRGDGAATHRSLTFEFRGYSIARFNQAIQQNTHAGQGFFRRFGDGMDKGDGRDGDGFRLAPE